MIITVATDFFIKDIINGIDELIVREKIPIRAIDVSSPVYQKFLTSLHSYFKKYNQEVDMEARNMIIAHDSVYSILTIKYKDMPQVQESYLMNALSDDTILCYSIGTKGHVNLLESVSNDKSAVITFKETDTMSQLANFLAKADVDYVEPESIEEDKKSDVDDFLEPISDDITDVVKNDIIDKVTQLTSDDIQIGTLNTSMVFIMSITAGGKDKLIVNHNSIFGIMTKVSNSVLLQAFDCVKPYEAIWNFKLLDQDKYTKSYAALVDGLSGEQLCEYVGETLVETPDVLDEGFWISPDGDSLFFDQIENEYVSANYQDNINKLQVCICAKEIIKMIEGKEVILSKEDFTMIDMNIYNDGELGFNSNIDIFSEASLQEAISMVGRALFKLPRTVYDAYRGIIGRMRASIKEFRDSYNDEDREMILNGEFVPEFAAMIRLLLGIAAGAATYFVGGVFFASVVNPVSAILVGLAVYIMKKMDDKRRRDNAFKVVMDELKILDEKIDDARANGDNKQKYELMRIKSALVDRMNRARYEMPV